MDKIADFIEDWILNKIKSDTDHVIVLKRNELAEKLACAPSQISYVLSTRFTVERGFIVESRRGSGGFVRIARIPIQRIVFEDAAKQISKDTLAEDFRQTLVRLSGHGLLTKREAALINQFHEIMMDRVNPDDQVRIVRRLLLMLANRGDI